MNEVHLLFPSPVPKMVIFSRGGLISPPPENPFTIISVCAKGANTKLANPPERMWVYGMPDFSTALRIALFGSKIEFRTGCASAGILSMSTPKSDGKNRCK